jgi:hypothetical protein
MQRMNKAAATAAAVPGAAYDRWRPFYGPAGGLLLAAAAALTVALFAKAEHESLAMTEGRFLAIEALLVLAAIGWLGRSFLPGLAAGATVFAALALPALPGRSATILFVLLLGFLLAAAPLARRPSLSYPDCFFFSLGLQALARPDLLLPPFGLRSAALLLMPALAAFALFHLARRFGGERALAAFAVVALLAPGFNVNAVLLLLAAAGAVHAGDAERWRPSRWAAGAALLLPVLLRWPEGLLAGAAGATLLLESLAPRWVLLPPFLAAVVAAALTGRPAGEPFEALLLMLALLPAALAAPGRDHLRMAAGVLLVVGAGWLTADSETWAAGGLLLALAVPARRPAVALQRWYFLFLLAGGLGLAAFPWLRPQPLPELASLLAPSPLHFFAAAVLLVLAPGLLAERLPAPPPWARAWPLLLPAILLAGWLLYRLPAAGHSLLGGEPQTLVEAKPRLRLEIGAFPFRHVVVDSQLFHGADLEPGQEVASLRFLGKGDAELLVLPLLAGDDTADWSAARKDVERRPDFRAPSPWLSQVAPDGTFFSGRYRRRFDLPQTIDALALEVTRAGGLPAATQVALRELELRP